jgi:hypothetical protein
MELMQLISSAFCWRQKPQNCIESLELSRDERNEVAAALNCDLKLLGAEALEHQFEAIYWLSPDAFCYFLPAIMLSGMRENVPSLIVYHSIVGMLDIHATSPSELDDFTRERFTRLTEIELNAVEHWLWWLSEQPQSGIAPDRIMRSIETVEMLRSPSTMQISTSDKDSK